ncbi:MAG TPA: LysM peptidoglycan-binding domain-containing protein, partial [Sedimentisphaerales bacterium]
QTVLYGHDPLGRVSTITYPGNFVLNNFYDALGRLTNQVDRAGRQMSYTYDLADRLRTRRYPNGVVQTNGYDDAGRLTGLSYAGPNISTSNSIQIALSYAYDSNGNKSGGGESGTFNWPLPSLTDDNSQFTVAGRLKSRQIQNNSAISNQLSQITYNYDANGNMTNASGNGQAWTLAYDEDNRTTSIQWDAGITSKNITNRYDAFGRRISKTTDGVTTGYVLSLVGGMEKVLCDLDGSGNVTAWYVHGPDLCYRVDSTNGLLCYHADAQANIIALTDGNTNLVAQYAYTPYGRSLGSTNFQLLTLTSQPYLFVGSQGVMEELPGLFFMRARYYSTDAGVFLSTDSVKKIGPGWKPVGYVYGQGNPLTYNDPRGEFIVPAILLAAGIYYFVHETYLKPTEAVLEVTAKVNQKYAGALSPQEENEFDDSLALTPLKVLPGGSVGVGIGYIMAGQGAGELIKTATGEIPGVTEFRILQNFGASLGYASIGIQNAFSSSGNNATHQSMTSQTVASSTQATTLNAVQATPQSSPTKNNPGTTGGGGGGTTSNSGGGGSATYTVKAGDTLGNIGSKFGSTATAIGQANGIQNLNLIHPGQVLTIPHR